MQKQLSRKQLAQYKKEDMFAKIGNLNTGMTTRSAQSGAGFAARVRPMIMDTSFGGGGSGAAITRNLTSPVAPRSMAPATSSSNLTNLGSRGSLMNTMEDVRSPSRMQTSGRYSTTFLNPAFQDIDLGSGGGLSAMANDFVVPPKLQLTMRQRMGNIFKRQTKVAAMRNMTPFANAAFEAGVDDFDFVNNEGAATTRNSRNFLELKQKILSTKQRFMNAYTNRMSRIRRNAAASKRSIPEEGIPLQNFGGQDIDAIDNSASVVVQMKQLSIMLVEWVHATS